jgi:O-antigen/teichoic acid export membrane protein
MTAPEGASARLRRLFRNTGIYALGDAGLQLITGLLAPLYTHLLAPEEFALWGLGALMMAGLANVFNPALHGAITRYYFDHEADAPTRRRFQGTVFTFLLLWSSALAVALIALSPWLFPTIMPGLPFWPYGLLALLTALLTVLGVVPKATWSAAERPATLVTITSLSTLTNLGVALALVAGFRVGVVGLFVARFAATAITTIPFLQYIRAHVTITLDGKMLRAALTFSLPLVPHLLSLWILALSDRWLIERLLSREALGVYTAAYVVIEFVNLTASSLNRAWVPQLTRALPDPTQRGFIARSVTWSLLTVCAVAVALALLAPPIMRIFFDPRYQQAADLADILAFAGIFQGLYYLYVAVLFFHRRNNLVPVITVTSGLINVGFNLWLLPSWGLQAAAWGTAAGYAALALGVFLAAQTMGGLPIERKRVLTILAWVGGAVAASALTDGWMSPGVELGARAGALLALLALLWFLPLWTAEERAAARAKLRRRAP